MSRIRNRLASQAGSVLVEVLVGTVLLALTTAAVLDGLDGAQKTGRKNKDRSASATLAQQDLERLRALPPSVLNGLSETRTVTVANVPYTVVSRSDWVSDASGLASCVSSNTQSEYMQLTSTVHSPASVDEPVSATSFLTPPVGAFGANTGTATVKLTDRDGEPHAGVGVSMTGPGSEIGATNDLGCAIFAYIPIGNWTAQVNGGLVNWSGESPAESQVTVAVNKTSLTQLEVDVPASLRASFVTPAGVATSYKAISVANSKLANGLKAYTWSPATATRDVESLFPFHDGYGVYAGSCKANNPANWDSDYFETAGFAALDPGEMLQSVDVVVPEIEITVRRVTGTTAQAFHLAQVYVKERDSAYGCTATLDSLTSPTNTSPGYSEYKFTVPVPFGNYEVCAATRLTTGSGNSSSWRRRVTASNTAPLHRNMTTTALAIANRQVTIDTSTSTSNQQCF
jgi:type II secretory pathway pseudopilin PulG